MLQQVNERVASTPSKQQLSDALLQVIALYFKEDAGCFIHFDQNVLNISDVDIMSLPTSPFIIGFGADVHTCRRYALSIQRTFLRTEVSDFQTAIAMMFGAYFIFNMEYNPSCVATCEYIQRELLGINPPKGTKSSKGKKAGVTVCPRLVTLLKKMSAFRLNTAVASTSAQNTEGGLETPASAQRASDRNSQKRIDTPASAQTAGFQNTEQRLETYSLVSANSLPQNRQNVESPGKRQKVDCTPCMYCEILYFQSDWKWFQCKRCLQWACKTCANLGRKRSFVCHACK